MKKYAYFVFKGELMCFMHVLLNALDMNEKGIEAKIILEGASVKLIQELEESKNPLYIKAKEKGLIDGVCKACSAKMGVLEYNEKSGIPILGEMSGHPAMEAYTSKGYDIITL
jgi:hypothetical protein